ncbi:hypothetical protein LUZ60_005975 [Juncus effusus]|nr:hypothetical protein LUZ60_005975 [Juncus effusus]
MGAQPSKPSPQLPIQTGTSTSTSTNPQYTAELSSYKAACRLDPDLMIFDSALQERTSRAISTLAVGVEVHSLSFGSLREVTGCLLDMNQEVVKVILECKKDIWKSPDLFSLVEEYFDCSLHTLDFCTALEKCLKRARDSQLLLHVALQRFDEEDEFEEEEEGKGQDGNFDGSEKKRKKYTRTLEELRHFKNAGDPFTDEFFQVFQSVYKQQLSMLDKLQQRKLKLDRKLKSIKAWRKVSSIIFAATFAAVLICSVVAAAIAAPPVAAALAAAASVPVGSMGKWIDSLLKGYQDALKGQKEVISAMQVGSYIAIKDLDSIKVLIDKLEIEINGLINNIDFALMDEDAVKMGVEEVKKRVEVFMKSLEDLGEQADRCSREIRRARTVVLQRIIRQPN